MADPTRRSFIRSAIGAGAGLGVGSLAAACGSAGASANVSSAAAAPTGKLTDLAAAGMPYRQADPRWGGKPMWDRKLVIKADTTLNGQSRRDAAALLYPYKDGNTIANEGCMLTCLAMVMRLLAPAAKPSWTPATLNRAAQDAYYYTRSGLSMVTLYPDLVAEMTEGNVQLAISQDYLPAMPSWPAIFANTAPLVRAYRSLSPAQRTNFLVMLKTGTYDDTVASHYVLLNPNAAEPPDSDDAETLDPTEPLKRTGSWRLSDSARWLTQEPQIASAWKRDGIKPTQISGAWVFSRWNSAHSAPLIGPLLSAWAEQ